MKRASLILLVRHGETDLNRDHKIRGWSNPTLTTKGRSQAEKAAKALKDVGVECIYSSDLHRAVETASVIGKRIGSKVQSVPALRPWNMGELTGKPSDKVQEDIAHYLKNRHKQIPGGESFDDFAARMMAEIERLEKLKEIVAVVTSQSNILTALAHGHPTVVEDHEPPPGSVVMYK